ncbi:hypothetical protein H8B09_28650 [Paenibacillus sp. PR3]|uniref:Lipoprotein n=1 Tax=Paenibacillus terricola TaxID=2763503 RepID=A0ABR8N3H5_9BACL|nr:DUF5991 domain-containing protein [Paenibacillus terricola]MBD3922713.1 hypothetical protein [Paenibacillus terricola]
MKNALVVIILMSLISLLGCSEHKGFNPIQGRTEQQQNDTSSTAAPMDIAQSQSISSTSPELDSWMGDYIFTEDITSQEYGRFYEVYISKENDGYHAEVTMDDSDAGEYSTLLAQVKGDTNRINLLFSGYSPDETNTNTSYQPGDQLMSLTTTNTGVITYWGKMMPINDMNKVDGTYFKMREKSEGYAGHWYTSTPSAGGNSTTIEVAKLTESSISFSLYSSDI